MKIALIMLQLETAVGLEEISFYMRSKGSPCTGIFWRS